MLVFSKDFAQVLNAWTFEPQTITGHTNYRGVFSAVNGLINLFAGLLIFVTMQNTFLILKWLHNYFVFL